MPGDGGKKVLPRVILDSLFDSPLLSLMAEYKSTAPLGNISSENNAWESLGS